MSIHRKVAEVKLSVLGELLNAPVEKGELEKKIKELSLKLWIDPRSRTPRRYGYATIERWYYKARKHKNPYDALMLKKRRDEGVIDVFDSKMIQYLERQYVDHSRWTVKLHYDNFFIWAKKEKYERVPCYGSLLRLYRKQGWVRSRYLQTKEKKSFESSFAGELWHLDFHHGKRTVVLSNGQRVVPICLAIMDDCTRVCCHIQWFIHETAEVLVHGFIQALLKRGLPRGLMTDNGAAMVSKEFTEGLMRLSINHHFTLPYSPYQNGKQESFWGSLEGRLMALLENDKNLSLEKLNQLTLTWVEHEYNSSVHSEIKKSPIDKWLESHKVVRPGPGIEVLRQKFRREIKRNVRFTDATFSLGAQRFEIIPQVYRSLRVAILHYAEWDLTRVDLVDAKTGHILTPVYPVDLTFNANRKRKQIATYETTQNSETKEEPPLLTHLKEKADSAGNPPSYLPMEEDCE
jgi:transposase InsO family protein